MFLKSTSHILSAQQPHVAIGYYIRQCRYISLPSLQKVLLDSTCITSFNCPNNHLKELILLLFLFLQMNQLSCNDLAKVREELTFLVYLAQVCPIELFAMRGMFSICTVQVVSHLPHVATDHLKCSRCD